MTKPTGPSMAELMFDSWMLAGEAGMVIWLRSLRMMAGGAAADREGRRMVAEKIDAGMTLWPALLAGGAFPSAEQLGERALAHYRGPVRANRRRLSRRA